MLPIAAMVATRMRIVADPVRPCGSKVHYIVTVIHTSVYGCAYCSQLGTSMACTKHCAVRTGIQQHAGQLSMQTHQPVRDAASAC